MVGAGLSSPDQQMSGTYFEDAYTADQLIEKMNKKLKLFLMSKSVHPSLRHL